MESHSRSDDVDDHLLACIEDLVVEAEMRRTDCIATQMQVSGSPQKEQMYVCMGIALPPSRYL